jgi:glutaredoxin-related protein
LNLFCQRNKADFDGVDMENSLENIKHLIENNQFKDAETEVRSALGISPDPL